MHDHGRFERVTRRVLNEYHNDATEDTRQNLDGGLDPHDENGTDLDRLSPTQLACLARGGVR